MIGSFVFLGVFGGFFANQAWSDSLSLVLKKETVTDTSPSPKKVTEISRIFEMPGTEFRFEQTITLTADGTEYHSNEIIHEKDNKTAASSAFQLSPNPKGVGYQAYLTRYIKLEAFDKTKGLGTIVLETLLQDPRVVSLEAEFSHSNLDSMRKNLAQNMEIENKENFNNVVFVSSHLGRVLGNSGFELDRNATSIDPLRKGVHFRFNRKPTVGPAGSCQSRYRTLVERILRPLIWR